MFEDHIVKPCEVQAKNGMRAFDTLKDAAVLAANSDKPDTLFEAMSLFLSASQRSIEMQKQWQEDWKDWVVYASKLPGADTTSKLVDRQNNIALQASAQMSKQTTQTLELIDNIFVSYSFWLSQQAQAVRKKDDCGC
ncbi:hypothetical protein GG681_00540 [Epibacterium sp. SM1969]|uniref:Phasin protein n=1 Tax=Tritonibacter aquimaris TaxID=2663379 RepID=A0A844AQ89_9RHOB|nr:hypothetical protein [Tritonibacter aquimaris]MQY41118.1 hypothetical protein [Tritonibacter aquimaris]